MKSSHVGVLLLLPFGALGCAPAPTVDGLPQDQH